MMTAEEIVAEFVGRVIECDMALRETFEGTGREGAGSPLSLLTADGRQVRTGKLEGIGEFRMHGIGCRFDLISGEIVDFDWDADGRESFDAWRLKIYADSLGFGSESQDSLRDAARRTAGLTEVRPGWFAFIV